MALKRATAISSAAILLITASLLMGCAGHASSSSEAIQHAKTLRTQQQQADYLVAQAKAFLTVKDYQEAVKTVRYILASVDSHSAPAQQLLEQANRQLAQDIRVAAGEAKPGLGL